MLSNVLGLLVAFVSIMLLLSMVVTGLVQATQSVFRLRSRNLLKCVGTLLKTLEVIPRNTPRMATRQRASAVLNHESVASVDQVTHPSSFVRHALLGPKVSWVQPEQLAQAIREYAQKRGDLQPDQRERARGETAQTMQGEPSLVHFIQRMQPAWSKRFQYFVRLITIGWSLIIAIGFQLSAPELFSALARDPARVALINPEADEIQQLAARMDGELVRPAAAASSVATDAVLDQLAQFGIRWFPHGWGYYYDPARGLLWGAVFGVLMTGILLAFGAPFWFEQLRNLSALRDLRAPVSKTAGRTLRKGRAGASKVTIIS